MTLKITSARETPSAPGADRLGVAAKAALALLMVSVAAAIILWSVARPHSPKQIGRAAAVLHALRLSHLSLSPTGRPHRAPEFMHAGIDLRFSPWLQLPEPTPETLFTVEPTPVKKKRGDR